MPFPIDWVKWERYRKEFEACLREGFAPPNVTGGKGSAQEEAERRLRTLGLITTKKRGTVADWRSHQERRAKRGQKNCLPDLGLFQNHSAVRVDATSRVKNRWLLTSAQNDTSVHRQFFSNLIAFASYLGARIHVGRFTYQVGTAAERAREAGEKSRKRDITWAPELTDFLTSERFNCGSILFCAEMNTLPTASRPLSGLHTYGQGKTAIFPHAKVALETVAAGPGYTPPVVLTTGACTVPSYTDTKAGLKGQFHHILGAVIVEESDDGVTFFRHVIGKHDGSFQDLDVIVNDDRITTGARIEAITFGDTQLPFLDADKAFGTWGFDVEEWKSVNNTNCIIDALKPRYGFYHDLIDFNSISHHDEKLPREQFKKFTQGTHLVEREINLAAEFLRATDRPFMKTAIIKSNHCRWLDRWLDRCDHRKDRDNALAFLRYEHARMEAEANGNTEFDTLKFAITERDNLDGVTWLPEDGSFVICQDSGGVECGWHGDLGPNGGSASPVALAKVSGKANVADKHTPSIVDGLYVAGTSSLLRRGFNKGPSSWRHADIITYPNGKRTLIFYEKERWRA